jgi:hypothetical protein
MWFGVPDWQPGILDLEPYRSAIELGPLDDPPVHDRNGNIPSRTVRTLVVEDLWSRSQLKPARYWLLAGSPGVGSKYKPAVLHESVTSKRPQPHRAPVPLRAPHGRPDLPR